MTPKEEKFYNALDIVRECFENSYSDGVTYANSNSEVKKDPRYLGIPNINFSLDYNKEKEEEYHKQRLDNGFDDSETWSLDYTIACFIYPRLKRFRELTIGIPAGLSEQEWYDILDTMLDGFYLAATDDNTETPEEEKERTEIIQKALDLFAKYFLHLWR